jgi:hypothetical protein
LALLGNSISIVLPIVYPHKSPSPCWGLNQGTKIEQERITNEDYKAKILKDKNRKIPTEFFA